MEIMKNICLGYGTGAPGDASSSSFCFFCSTSCSSVAAMDEMLVSAFHTKVNKNKKKHCVQVHAAEILAGLKNYTDTIFIVKNMQMRAKHKTNVYN